VVQAAMGLASRVDAGLFPAVRGLAPIRSWRIIRVVD